ncbi:hypothetical protein FJ364_01690 [Candidatus Dependentiae bacterium]|nr:hypothetical protein [Candidatus Dependentiae bacterium]
MEKLKLCKKINSAMTSIKYIFSVIGATPGLNLSPYSTTQVPEVLNIRTSYHFKNSYNFGDFNEKLIEALIIETGFHLHDKLDMEALPFMKQQSYASLYQEYYTDNQITIFVRRDILEKHYNALKVRYHYDGE